MNNKKHKRLLMRVFYSFSLILFFSFIISSEVKAWAEEGDTTPPTISVIGPLLSFKEAGTIYTDLGATATDNVDGDLTESIVVVNPVDTNIYGSYLVTYNVKDSSGNSAVQAARLVFVGELGKPGMPVATPAAGIYTSSQSVSLSSTDEGSGIDKIYYTIDGTIPNRRSLEYTDPIVVAADMTIKAIAYDKTGNRSETLEAVYKINKEVSDDSDDEDDDDDDDNDKKSKNKKQESSTGGAGYVSGEAVLGEETDGNQSQTDSTFQNNSEQQGLVAGEEVSNVESEGGSSIWWWLIGLLILLGAGGAYRRYKMRNK